MEPEAKPKQTPEEAAWLVLWHWWEEERDNSNHRSQCELLQSLIEAPQQSLVEWALGEVQCQVELIKEDEIQCVKDGDVNLDEYLDPETAGAYRRILELEDPKEEAGDADAI